MDPKPWTQKDSKEIYRNNWYWITHDKLELPGGTLVDYFPVRTKNSVGIIAVTDENEIIFVKQYRHTAQTVTLELPWGGCEEHETPEQTAKRELEEEARYTADNFRSIGHFMPANGVSTERCYLYLATGLTSKHDAQRDETESDMETVIIPAQEAIQKVIQQKEPDGMVICALTMARPFIKNL